MHGKGWLVWTGQKKSSSKLKETIYTCPKPHILARWEKRGIWKERGISIDWDANNLTIHATPVSRRHCLTKQVSKILGWGAPSVENRRPPNIFCNIMIQNQTSFIISSKITTFISNSTISFMRLLA